MSIKPVRLFLDPILHKPCELITDFTGLDNLAGDMIETCLAYKGVGLAANQIAVDKNIALLYLENKTKLILVANLLILRYTKETDIQKEGCLSCPGVSVPIERPLGVEFEYYNLSGEKKQMKLEGFDARIFFHEYQHLQGILIIDNLMKL